MKILFPVFAAACATFFIEGCEPRKAAAPPALPEVSVITVKTEEAVLSTERPGRAGAFLVAEVRPQIGGIIQKRLFEEGTDVKQGDVLYLIDPARYQASYDKAKAELKKAEAQIISIERNFERCRKLIGSSSISQKDFDVAESDLKMAEAEIMSCKAEVETARINLAYTKIVAPISGRIGRSYITVGALVAANHAAPLAIIQQIDSIYVDVTQSNASLLRLKREMSKGLIKEDAVRKAKVKLLLEDGTVYPLKGTLQFRDVTVDQSTGSFILRIVFPNPDKVLLPGMFVRAVMETGVSGRAILIPQQAVSRDPKGRAVALTVSAAGKVGQRILNVEQTIGDKWLVSEGLAAGDRVIMEGMQKVRPGADVKAIPFNEVKNSPNAPQTAATAN